MRWLSLGVLGLVLGLLANGCFEVRAYPGPAPCSGVKDCDDGTVCTLDACDDGQCVHEPVDANVPEDGNACTAATCANGSETILASTGKGMCGRNQNLDCDADGKCVGCNLPSQCGDDTECRTWTCVSSMCVAVLSAAGTACQDNGVCDSRGNCALCTDGVQNGGETDVDCGGRCSTQAVERKCAVDLHCDVNTDCASGVCTQGICANG